MIDFDPNGNEKFRIALNGETIVQEVLDKQNWQTYESHSIPMGAYSLDIAVLSDVQSYNPNYKSKAQVLIKRLSLIGTV
jgi:hypothetical protein